MDNSPEQQTMNRRVLEAISTLQDGKFVAVSKEAIIEQVIPLMQREDDLQNLQKNIMDSVYTLKQVGLLTEPRSSEFALCRCPVKSEPSPTMKRQRRSSRSTPMRLPIADRKTKRSLLKYRKKRPKVICTNCRTVIASFSNCYEDLKKGRTVASRLPFTTIRQQCLAAEPIEVIGDQTNQFETVKPDDESTDRLEDGGGDAPAAVRNDWNFNSPIPIEVPKEQVEY